MIGCDKDPCSTVLSEVMTSPVLSCKRTDDIEELFKNLSASERRHLLVLENNEPVGVISLRDISFVLHHADLERARSEVSGVRYI